MNGWTSVDILIAFLLYVVRPDREKLKSLEWGFSIFSLNDEWRIFYTTQEVKALETFE